MASKLVFIGGGALKAPPCHSGCIPDAASSRVNVGSDFNSSVMENPNLDRSKERKEFT